MTRGPALGVLLVGSVAVLGCMGGGPTTYDACDCSFELPSGWDVATLDDDSDGWQVESWGSTTSLRVQYIEHGSQPGPFSASVMHDAWLHRDWTIPVDIAPTETIDGREASIREVGTYWTAMVPYDDGWVYLEVWSEDGSAGWDDGVEVATSLSRPEVPVQLSRGNLAPETRSESVLERSIEVAYPVTMAGPGFEVPNGWLPSDYASDVGRLRSWVTPMYGTSPRPAVVYVHDGPWVDARDLERLAPLERLGVPLMVPTFRGEQSNPGAVEAFGGEVDDLRSAIEAFRGRGDVGDLYLIGEGTGAPLALFGALGDESITATVLIDGPLDIDAWRQHHPETVERRIPIVADDTVQSAVRSPIRYLPQLQSPVWSFHAEFSSMAAHGEAAMQIAQEHGVPFHWFVVPRAVTVAWQEYLLDATARRIALPFDEDGEERALSFDDGFVTRLGRRAWERRWVALRQDIAEEATLLAGTHLLRPGRVTEVLVEESRWVVDARAIRMAAKATLEDWPGTPPSEDAARLRTALSKLSVAGLAVRAARPSEDPEARLSEALQESPARGFVYMRARGLLESLRRGASLKLFYGDGFPRTEDGTRTIGREIARVLTEEGLDPIWDGDPDSAIQVSVRW